MVALLVLATFIVFITVDFLLHRDKYKFRVTEARPAAPKLVAVPVVAGVALPETLAYHPGHTWVADQGNGRLRIGLDELAGSLLGAIQKIDVPQRGRWVRQGEKGWTVQTAKGVAVMLSPAEGEVVSVNDKAVLNPEAVQEDPYGSGWLFEVYSPDSHVSLRNLLSGSLARRWMEEAIEDLRHAVSPAAMATAMDGGRLAPKLGTELPQEKWRELTTAFFRS